MKLSGDLMVPSNGAYTLDATSAPERAALRRNAGRDPWTSQDGLFARLQATWLPKPNTPNAKSPGFKYTGDDADVKDALLDACWDSLAATAEGARVASTPDGVKHAATYGSCAAAFEFWDSGDDRSFFPGRDATQATLGRRKRDTVSNAASGRKRRSKSKKASANA